MRDKVSVANCGPCFMASDVVPQCVKACSANTDIYTKVYAQPLNIREIGPNRTWEEHGFAAIGVVLFYGI